MKKTLAFMLIMSGCAPSNLDLTAQNAKNVDGGTCTYHDPVDVTLEFVISKKFDDFYEANSFTVDFNVNVPGGGGLASSATLTQKCKEFFEKQKVIPAKLEKIRSGVCAPIVITPENFGNNCGRGKGWYN